MPIPSPEVVELVCIVMTVTSCELTAPTVILESEVDCDPAPPGAANGKGLLGLPELGIAGRCRCGPQKTRSESVTADNLRTGVSQSIR